MLSQGPAGLRQWLPSAGVALLMLPVLLWFGLDLLHITPRPQPLTITANPEAALLNATAAAPPPPSPPPPPPVASDDWQLALESTNASVMPPPIFFGNWRRAAAARLRWFEPDGLARYNRSEAWWGYPDPLQLHMAENPDWNAAEALGGSGAGGGGGGGESNGGGASDAGAAQKDVSAAEEEAAKKDGDGGGGGNTNDRSGGGGGGGDAAKAERKRRRLAQTGRAKGGARGGGDSATEGDMAAAAAAAETWAASDPPLQKRGPDVPDGLEERSYFIDWIYQDLEPWKKHGIHESDVQRAWDLAAPRQAGPYCYGDQIHFQIVGGRLYVDYQTNNKRMPGVNTRETEGWFPGSMGAGLTAAKGHMPYVLFTLLDVLRSFPGQVPDVSAVLHTSDFPCLKANRSVPDIEFRQDDSVLPKHHFSDRPIPVMGYNRKDGFMDLMFPDFTYFGHEYSQVVDPDGRMLNGWQQQLDVMVATHAFTPLEKRKPKVMWRGRASDDPRDDVRRRFQSCPGELAAAGHKDAKEMFDVVAPPMHEITSTRLMDNGEYRYPVYIDAGAYVSNLKHKLAVGSPLLMVTHRYHEWYSRSLLSGITHIDVPDDETMCNETWAKVQLMEAMVNEHAEAVAAADHPPPPFQLFAANWSSQPWGAITESALREWTLAARGMAVNGYNAYEDSAGYVAPPEPLPANLSSDASGGNGEEGGPGGGEHSGSAEAAAAEGAAASDAGGGGGWLGSLLGRFSGGVSEPQRQLTSAKRQALYEARDRIGARREWARRQREADKARQAWERKQDKLKRGIPWDIWSQADAAWGTGMLPWEIAAAGQLFVRDRLRIRDVRLYVRDLLIEYSRLQKFQPKITKRARCIDWERMLMEFEWPHYKEDLDQLLFFYPYLRSPFNYNCSDDPHEQGRAPYTPGHDGAGDWDKEEAYQASLRKAQQAAAGEPGGEPDGGGDGGGDNGGSGGGSGNSAAGSEQAGDAAGGGAAEQARGAEASGQAADASARGVRRGEESGSIAAQTQT